MLIIQFFDLLLTVLIWAIFIRVIVSWIWPNSENGFIRFIIDITNPIMIPARKITPKTGMLDFSPLVALIVLDLIRYFLNVYF